MFARPARASFGNLSPHHAAAAAALHATAFAHGWSELDFERLLAADTSVTDAAFAPKIKDPVGYILSRRAADEAEVLTIVVARSWRGRGLARALLDRHVEQLVRRRVRALFLEVAADNLAARALYARAGFAEVGRRKAYYPGLATGARVDALVLRRPVG